MCAILNPCSVISEPAIGDQPKSCLAISETRAELIFRSSGPVSTRSVKSPSRVLGIHCTKPTGGERTPIVEPLAMRV